MEYTWIYLVAGSLLFSVGFVLYYLIKRRQFYRRNVAGLEVFYSFERAWGTSCLEKLGRLIGILLMLLGLFLVCGYFVTKKSAKKEVRVEDTETPGWHY